MEIGCLQTKNRRLESLLLFSRENVSKFPLIVLGQHITVPETPQPAKLETVQPHINMLPQQKNFYGTAEETPINVNLSNH